MRKRPALLLALLLFLLPCPALGEALPAEVLALCQAAYPGYEPAMFDGWDGGKSGGGQYAVVMHNDDPADNALLILERAQGEAAYAVTVDAPNAVRDFVLPDRLIIDNIDVLFYTYEYDTYHTQKKNGVWQAIDTIHASYPVDEPLFTFTSGIADGELGFTKFIEDENGNVLDTIAYPPIPVGDAFIQSMLPANFDIERFNANPDVGMYIHPDMCACFLGEGETIKYIDLKPYALVMVVAAPDGTQRVRVAEWDGAAYAETYESAPYAGDILLDSYHTGNAAIAFWLDERDYLLMMRTDGGFVLNTLTDGGGESFVFMPEGLIDSSIYFNRNDGAIYGGLPDLSLGGMDFAAMLRLCDDPAAMIDSSAYALVHNPNPADRLHLRARPDKSSASLGKFYNRTPARILERRGDWTRVRIGSGAHVLEGWMMTAFLAFDEGEKAALACAFPQLFVAEERDPDGVPLLDAPDGKPTGLTASHHTLYFVLGVVGDDWYVVQLRDGSVGYIPQDALWAGNG